jgi:hypothetical protein
MTTVSLGIIGGGLGGAALAFRGRYAFRNLRSLPSMMDPSTRKLDQAVLRDYLVFSTKALFFASVGMLAGTQLGAFVGFRLSSSRLNRDGNRERIAKVLEATRRDMESTIKQQRLQKLPRAAGGVDGAVNGEETRLAAEFEKEQPASITDDSGFVSDAMPSQEPVESSEYLHSMSTP